MRRAIALAAVMTVTALPGVAAGQINFAKDGYYVALGDSVAAGEGGMPATNGYTFQLYEQAAFGPTQQTDFANAAVRGARSWELRDHQVPQVLCAEPALRPTVVTITSGANDFLRGDGNIPAIAARVVDAIGLLLNNDRGLVINPVRDPVTGTPCRALANVTILVSNYYRIPHPVPQVAAQLDAALHGFDQALRFWLQFLQVPEGSRVALVDLYAASEGESGLVTIERRLGYESPADFDVHPTNRGHSFIARSFAAVWDSLR